ncbi:MAG: hypothetical protein KDB90_00260 [Planctomycetes bacterium]|nr:hypothetical protein [Planctomycetota bacterium]
MRSSAKAVLLACVLLMLAACGPTGEDIVNQRRADAEPKLKQIEELGAIALKLEQEPEGIQMPEGAKLRFREGRNAALLQTEKFASGDAARPSLDLIIEYGWLEEARSMLSQGAGDSHPDYVSGVFDALDSLEYLVLVRTRMYADPAITDSKMFSPGWWQADVMVFVIKTGKCLGISAVEATNSDEVDAKLTEPDKWLHSDLWGHARTAVNEALKACSESPALG